MKTFGFVNILLQVAFQFALQLVDKIISFATPLSVFLTTSLMLTKSKLNFYNSYSKVVLLDW